MNRILLVMVLVLSGYDSSGSARQADWEPDEYTVCARVGDLVSVIQGTDLNETHGLARNGRFLGMKPGRFVFVALTVLFHLYVIPRTVIRISRYTRKRMKKHSGRK